MIELHVKGISTAAIVILGTALLIGACAPKSQPPSPASVPAGQADSTPAGPGQPAAEGQENGGAPQAAQPPVGAPIQITDESEKDPALAAVLKSLREAVAARDANRLLALVPDTVRYTFGTDNGKQGFIKEWKLDSDPEQSPIWAELGDVLALGGSLADGSRYSAPYLFTHFPEQYDAFQYLAVIGDGVVVREAASPDAAPLTRLSWTVVKAGGPPVGPQQTVDGRSYGWRPVVLEDGREGYVLERYVRSPIDYRLLLGKNKAGDWEIQAFVAGD